ncbi:MAG: YceK/YidQ family lipoprotein [Gammaproteobacteria bacterium]|nr:MAG: YceK/YidQ family lipoprotein [Gammaproteobacteria bacterium]
MLKTKLLLILLSCSLISCGTIKSLDHENNQVHIKHRLVTTKCQEIPYIYSGVRYDFCILHAYRKQNVPAKLQLDPAWVLSVDFVFSGIADTLVLPYTAYQQYKYGNLVVIQ